MGSESLFSLLVVTLSKLNEKETWMWLVNCVAARGLSWATEPQVYWRSWEVFGDKIGRDFDPLNARFVEIWSEIKQVTVNNYKI